MPVRTRYSQYIPEEERGSLIKAYYKRLTSEDKELGEDAAKHWTTWEIHPSFAKPNLDYMKKGEDPAFASAFACIETQYFVNMAWLPALNHIHGERQIDSPCSDLFHSWTMRCYMPIEMVLRLVPEF